MDIREWKLVQEKAFNVFVRYHHVNFQNEDEVLEFLHEIHPYMSDISLNLPKAQLFQLLERHGYYEKVDDSASNTRKMIANLMSDIEIEQIMGELMISLNVPFTKEYQVH